MTSNEWKNYKFSELVYILGGGTPKTTVSEYWNGTIPWLSVKDFNSGEKFVYTTEKTITQLGLKKSSTQLLKKNDIILSARGTVGEIAVIPFLMAFNQSCYGIRAKEEIINSDFLYYLLKNSINLLKHNTHGSVFDTITRETFDNIAIKLPPLETQQKIAKILSAIDDKIELNNSINNNLEQQAQAIFKSWFVDFEPFNGIIPDDWSEDILGNFIEIKRGGSPRPIQDYIADSGYRWLKISDATSIQSPFILNIKEHIKESGINKTVLLKSGSLVLSNSATPGIPKILDVDSCIHDGWLYFPKSMLSNEYLYLLFKFIRPNLVALGNGSVFTNLKTDILRNYNTILPDKETLIKFDGVVSVIFKQILYNTRENEKLIQLRDTLLPKLMSGEIDVSKVEIDDILENQSSDKLLFREDK